MVAARAEGTGAVGRLGGGAAQGGGGTGTCGGRPARAAVAQLQTSHNTKWHRRHGAGQLGREGEQALPLIELDCPRVAIRLSVLLSGLCRCAENNRDGSESLMPSVLASPH